METAKEKVKTTLLEYIKLFPEEWSLFRRMMDDIRLSIKDKYAHMRGTSTDLRYRSEMPEKLHSMLSVNLTPEEAKWFFNNNEGTQWFVNTFKDFKVAEKV